MINSNLTSVKDYTGKLFLFFSFFPYIKIIPINTDLQPLAFFFGLLYLCFLVKIKIRLELNYILISVFTAISFLLISNIDFAVFRSIFGYFNVFIISIASYNYFRLNKEGLSYRFLRNVLSIYLFCSLIQKYINHKLFHFLLNRDNSFEGAQGRGVESLTAEPTFYGFILLLIIPFVIISSYSQTQKNKLFFLIIIQLVFLSKSTSAIGTLLLCFIPFLILYWRWFLIISFSFFILFSFLFLYDSSIVLETRAYKILLKLSSEGLVALSQSDPSSRGRLYHMFFSLKGGIENYLLPNGFNNFADYMLEQKVEYSELRWKYVKFSHGRILSYFGSMIYELGIFSFPIICFYFKGIFALKSVNVQKGFLFILYFGVLLQAITLAHPTVPLFFGMTLAYINRDK